MIGYDPHSPDYSHPADRRKFYFYLNAKGFSFERASLNKYYDLVYVTVLSDIDAWSRYRDQHSGGGARPRVIFDLSDAYLEAHTFDLKNSLRGAYRYLTGRTSRLRWSYKNALLDMMKGADAVICASVEQKALLDRYHPNVHVIHDYFGGDIRERKERYSLGKNGVNVVWEGLSHGNRRIFTMLRDILAGYRERRVNLHVISDQDYCEYGGRYLCQSTSNLLQRTFAGTGVRVYFYSWHPATFSSIAAACDFAAIPIPDDPIMLGKPENKLILSWSLGLPVIATATESYSRVMREAGVDWTCTDLGEWNAKIHRLTASQEAQEQYMRAAKNFVDKHYSKAAIVARWDALFGTLSIGSNTLESNRG